MAVFETLRGFRGFRKCKGFEGVLFGRFELGSPGSTGSIGSRLRRLRSDRGTLRAPIKGMATARSHEELVCWQLAHKLKLDVYELIETGPISRDTDLCDQLRRSARSVPRLMAEGFGRYLPGEFKKYLR